MGPPPIMTTYIFVVLAALAFKLTLSDAFSLFKADPSFCRAPVSITSTLDYVPRNHDAALFSSLINSPVTKRAPELVDKDKMCPSLEARGQIRKESNSQLLDASPSLSGSVQAQSEEFFDRGMELPDDGDWDELDVSSQETPSTDHEHEESGTISQIHRRHQLEIECAQYEEKDMRVSCMVDTVMRSTRKDLTIEEEGEKVKIVQRVTGQVIFQDP